MAKLQVAVVGSGPAGCYVVEGLGRRGSGRVQIDVFERLPTPFGLVRGGVAPDHQGTKAIVRVFARALTADGVRLFGNVEIGRDLSLATLRRAYDAVVLATGAPEDRRLGIPGENLAGVVGSAAFVGWYNRHPDRAGLALSLSRLRSAVIIGNGNVAIDVARVLAGAGAEMERSDLDPEVEAAISSAPLTRILIAGRRGAGDVRFTPAEVAGLGRLRRAAPVVDAADIAAAGIAENPSLAVLRQFADQHREPRPVAIAFGFGLTPVRMVDDGSGRVGAVRFLRCRPRTHPAAGGSGEVEQAAELVVTCIGYRAVACGELAPGDGWFANDRGRIAEGLYVAGWAGRAPSGTIPTNRTEGHAIAARILAEVAPGAGLGRDAVLAAVDRRRVIDFDGWKRIDAAETARAPADRVRRKFARIDEMLAAAEDGLQEG
jgi:ferredoxin--NADP+ reductase